MAPLTSMLPPMSAPESQPQAAALPPGGTVRPIVRWGAPVMHRTLEPITSFDDELRRLVADMVATMYAAEGVGLAACQIGVDRSMFVFDCPDADHVHDRGVVCNPELYLPVGRNRRMDDGEEGCLSLPGAFISCSRPDFARVQGQGLEGEPVSYSGTGLLARCLQHETDHCRGTVFGDKLHKRTRKKLFNRADELAADYPDDWPVSPAASHPESPSE